MKVGRFTKGIVFGTLITFAGQMIHETSLIERKEPKHNPMAVLNIPMGNHSPIPEHGPHSQPGIVYTIDGIIAVSTSSSTFFAKALG